MNKKLKKLQKALLNLGIESEHGDFSDGSDEWLTITEIRDGVLTTIEINRSGETAIFQAKAIWDRDNEKKIL